MIDEYHFMKTKTHCSEVIIGPGAAQCVNRDTFVMAATHCSEMFIVLSVAH